MHISVSSFGFVGFFFFLLSFFKEKCGFYSNTQMGDKMIQNTLGQCHAFSEG